MKIKAIVATLIVGSCAASPAAAQMQCLPYENLTRIMDDQFGEHLTNSGWKSTENGIVIVQIYTSEDGTWTMVMVQPDGKACILANGQGWQDEAGGEPV